MRPLLCINLGAYVGASCTEQLDAIRAAGFDGYFMSYSDEPTMRACAAHAKELGLYLQSIHAPFSHVCDLWHGTKEEAQRELDRLLDCLRITADLGATLMVVHPFIGFERHEPTAQGLSYFEQLVAAAEKAGVRLAFENVEGIEYLHAVMAHFAGRSSVGFCWDTGHALCYNGDCDPMADYQSRLMGTHLNDNLGVHDRAGKITWLDDLHLLPFDGVNSWQKIADRLQSCGFTQEWTFELTTKSKPGRHDNDLYAAMPIESYYALCYQRACRAAALLNP